MKFSILQCAVPPYGAHTLAGGLQLGTPPSLNSLRWHTVVASCCVHTMETASKEGDTAHTQIRKRTFSKKGQPQAMNCQ